MMMPANNFYQDLAAECNKHRICVDLFYGLNEKISVDLATVVPVCGMTGGELTFYQPFDVVKHGEKLYYNIFHVLTRTTGTEVAIKARCSTGLTVTEYMGSHLSYQTAEMIQAWIDSDKVISCTLRNDEKLKEDSLVYF